MGDGIFVASNEWENKITTENLNSIDNIDDVSIYSFTTFDSLKEYTQVYNLKHSNFDNNNYNDNESKNSLDDYLIKLRTPFKKAKKLNQNEDIINNNINKSKNELKYHKNNEMKIKTEKLNKFEINNNNNKSYSLIWQPKLNETILYDYDDNITGLIGNSIIKSKSKCGKEHCNYGCICDTISNQNSITRDHCGRYECMFECICTNKKNFFEEINTNNFSESCSNDDFKSALSSSTNINSTRRSKRQKYLSLKAFEYFENGSMKTSTQKRNKYDTESFKEKTYFNNKKFKKTEINRNNHKKETEKKFDGISKNNLDDKEKRKNVCENENVKKDEKSEGDYTEIENTIKKIRFKSNDIRYKDKLRKKLNNQIIKNKNWKYKNDYRKKHLKNLKLTGEIDKIRNQFQNRIKTSIKYQINDKKFKPYVQSVILKIETNNKNQLENDKNQLLSNKNKNNQTIIPLYVEVFTEWSTKKNEIFRKIVLIIRKFYINKIDDWEQIEFDYDDITIRLNSSSSSKSFLKLNNELYNNTNNKLNPIFVKIIKLNKDEKVNYVNKLKSKNEFNSVNTTSIIKDFNSFLTYSKINKNENMDHHNTANNINNNNNNNLNIDINTITVTSSINNASTHNLSYKNSSNTCVIKTIPRLLCRKRFLTKPKSLFIEQNKDLNEDNNNNNINIYNNFDNDKSVTINNESYNTISQILLKYRPDEYSNVYYNPFKDEKLIIPLYHDYGRHFVDEISDIVNNMIKGVCLYDEHLKNIEKKRIENEEKNRKFLNFTQKILYDTKLFTNTSSTFPSLISSVNQNNMTNSSIKSVLHNSKMTLLTNNNNNINNNNQNVNSVIPVYSTIPTKRITPILPKLPPCIKIISNNINNNNNNNNKLNTIEDNIINDTNKSNPNIITKLLSKSNNQIINTKIFSTSSVNQKTQIITTNNSDSSSLVQKVNNINQDDTNQQYKTLIKLVSISNGQNEFNDNNKNNIDSNRDDTNLNKVDNIKKPKHNLQFIKVSSKIIKQSEILNDNLIPKVHNFSNKINFNTISTNTTGSSNASKMLMKESQRFNNLIITPASENNTNNENNKTIFKILSKNNETELINKNIEVKVTNLKTNQNNEYKNHDFNVDEINIQDYNVNNINLKTNDLEKGIDLSQNLNNEIIKNNNDGNLVKMFI